MAEWTRLAASAVSEGRFKSAERLARQAFAEGTSKLLNFWTRCPQFGELPKVLAERVLS